MPVRPTIILEPRHAAKMLLGLVAVNKMQMEEAGPNRPRVIPLIQRRIIRYDRNDPDEHWKTYNEVMSEIQRDGYSLVDCEDLGCLGAAEMQLPGPFYDPTAFPDVYRTGPRLSHVIIRSQRFGAVDPSITAGMGWAENIGASPETFLLGCAAAARGM